MVVSCWIARRALKRAGVRRDAVHLSGSVGGIETLETLAELSCDVFQPEFAQVFLAAVTVIEVGC